MIVSGPSGVSMFPHEFFFFVSGESNARDDESLIRTEIKIEVLSANTGEFARDDVTISVLAHIEVRIEAERSPNLVRDSVRAFIHIF